MARRTDAQPRAVEAQAPAPACVNCRYWLPADDGLGECRRYPPAGGVKQATAIGPLTLPVVTAANHWCGEYRARTPGV